MGKNAVDRTVGSAQRENVCACLSSLELPAMINLVQAHALTLYVQAKACVMAKLENAFRTKNLLADNAKPNHPICLELDELSSIRRQSKVQR